MSMYSAYEKQEDLEIIADTMGGYDPEILKDIINWSNSGYILHGIKRFDDVRKINVEGVRNLTPEGGLVSYWTSGMRIFGSVQEGRLDSYDSSFFHYAHSENAGDKLLSMNIVVADYSSIASLADGFRKDSCIRIPSPIPRSMLHIVSTFTRPGDRSTTRDDFMTLERMTADALHELAQGNYRNNGETVVNTSLKYSMVPV